jgi:uncharacterized protein
MFYKKEKEVNELFLKHLQKVDECLKTSLLAVENYLNGKIDEAKGLAKKVDSIETEADFIRHEIIGKMYSGAYLPLLREDILHLLEQLDKIADGAESCCDFFLDQRPEIPDDLKPRFLSAMQTSVSSFAFLKDAVISFFSEKDETESIREMLKKVGIIESDVDKQEWDITRDIFKTNLDYGHKVHLRHCIQRVVEISDRVEDTADQLEITIIKGGI